MTQQQATRFLAEKAMGWGLDLGKSWSPFTDANDALEVLEAMRAKGWGFSSHNVNDQVFFSFDKNAYDYEAAAKSLSAAICRAAVLAFGGEVENG